MARYDQKQVISVVSLHRSCENSAYALSRVEAFLKINGYRIVENIASSDIVIINTCAYSDRMRLSNERTIKTISASFPDKKLIVFGCLVGLNELQQSNHLVLVGNAEIDCFSDMFEHSLPLASVATNRLTRFNNYQKKITASDRYIQIAEGCSNNCSYCNIKLIKGEVRSRAIDVLRREAADLLSQNAEEITLLADDCGSYGNDTGSNIGLLLREFASLDEHARFKIYTIFPGLLIKYYRELKPFLDGGKITYICTPLQSGSRRVLQLMNRNYDLAELRQILNDIRIISPDTYLYSHFIINFPTETVADFEASLEWAALFDSSMFIGYEENQKTRAHGITPKCTERDLHGKIGMLNNLIREGHIKGAAVGV